MTQTHPLVNRQLEEKDWARIDELDPCDRDPGRVKRPDDQARFDRLSRNGVVFQFEPDGRIRWGDFINDDGCATTADIEKRGLGHFCRLALEPG